MGLNSPIVVISHVDHQERYNIKVTLDYNRGLYILVDMYYIDDNTSLCEMNMFGN
jgi:hypothetical protein